MLTPADRELALSRMEEACSRFYRDAIRTGNHPFIEFTGVMQAYIKSCRRAHEAGIDFSDCNRHTGQQLPIESFELAYLAEKLDCIFDGRIEVRSEPATEALS